MKKDVVNILKLKLLNAIIGSIKLCFKGWENDLQKLWKNDSGTL